jgi:hypothetical protein
MKAAAPQQQTDPNLVAEQERAQRSLVNNLQTQAQMDTANIMTRYGTAVAIANSGIKPVAAPASTPTLVF